MPQQTLADALTTSIQGDRFTWIIDRMMGNIKPHHSVDKVALSGKED
jgi:hypothetical protein